MKTAHAAPRQSDSLLHRALRTRMLLWMLLIFAVQSGLLYALSILIETNVDFMIPVLSDVVPILTEAAELLGIGLGYAAVLYALYRFPGHYAVFSWIYLAATLWKYLLRILVTGLLDGRITAGLLIIHGLSLLFEALLFLLLLLISARMQTSFRRSLRPEAYAADPYPDRAPYLPFRSLFSFRNPLQTSAMAGGALISVSKILNLLVYDLDYGLPASFTEWIWVVSYYLLYILIGVLAYFLLLYCFLLYDQRDLLTREIATLPQAARKGLFRRAGRQFFQACQTKDQK